MGDVKMKTISYDPAVYNLVPVEPTTQMVDGSFDGISFSWDAMLAAVPDQLPGVVEYGGEPSATVIKRGSDRQWMSERLGHLPDGIYNLFIHPAPSQPSADLLELEAAISHCLHIAATEGCSDCGKEHSQLANWLSELQHLKQTQPSAEALVQAALEAACEACKSEAESMDNDWNRALGIANDLKDAVMDAFIAIRALDKQKIIESCKEKS